MKIKILKRLLGYMGKGKTNLVISVLSAIICSSVGVVIPYLAGKAIDRLDVDNGVVDFNGLYRFLMILVVLTVVSSVFQLLMNTVNNRLSYDVICRIRNDAYGKIKRLPISYIDSTSVGNIQSMVINDCETVGDGLLLFLKQFFSGITAIAFTLGIMFYLDWRIALFVSVFTPVSFVFAYFIASRSFNSFKRQSKIRAEQTSLVSEVASNFRTIHVFNTEDNIIERFEDINDRYRDTSGKATFYSSVTNPSTRFINALIYAGVAFIGAGRVIGADLTVGVLAMFLSYSTQFMKPFNDLSSVYTELTDSFACLDRIFNFLDEPEMNDDLAKTQEGPWDKKKDFEIEFRNVSFSYKEGQPVIRNVSFKVASGSSCAIVGPTGCGKTTIINLLMRYYEIDSGEILVNGVDISQIPRNVLRSYLGVVSQDTWFRNGPIMDNIKFGNPSMSDESAKETARKSGADSFIRKLPDKFDERIDSSRDDISEGQRQLLSITRAMAANPSILILDEATSSLDILTEVKIQKAVKELLEGRTSIIIAHRLSTIIDADMIVVMEDGRISEIGKHADLIKNDGFYTKLYRSYIE